MPEDKNYKYNLKRRVDLLFNNFVDRSVRGNPLVCHQSIKCSKGSAQTLIGIW